MSVILYYTEFFGEIMYEGDPGAEKGTPERQNYEEGLRMGSLGLFCQNVVAMLCSFFIDNFIQKFGRRNVYLSTTVRAVKSMTLKTELICLLNHSFFRFLKKEQI